MMGKFKGATRGLPLFSLASLAPLTPLVFKGAKGNKEDKDFVVRESLAPLTSGLVPLLRTPAKTPKKAAVTPWKNGAAYLVESKRYPATRQKGFSDFSVPIRPGCLSGREAA